MEITTRESQMLITMDYKDGCTKKINILKNYYGDEKTPNLRWMTVEYINPDGTINEDRSNTYKGNMDESDTEYENQNILVEERIADISTTIYYKDGCEKTINISISHDGIGSSPYTDCNSVELKYPDGTIDKKRSKKNKRWISKIGESDFENEKCYRFAFEKHKYKHIPLRNNNLRNHYAFILSLNTL